LPLGDLTSHSHFEFGQVVMGVGTAMDIVGRTSCGPH